MFSNRADQPNLRYPSGPLYFPIERTIQLAVPVRTRIRFPLRTPHPLLRALCVPLLLPTPCPLSPAISQTPRSKPFSPSPSASPSPPPEPPAPHSQPPPVPFLSSPHIHPLIQPQPQKHLLLHRLARPRPYPPSSQLRSYTPPSCPHSPTERHPRPPSASSAHPSPPPHKVLSSSTCGCVWPRHPPAQSLRSRTASPLPSPATRIPPHTSPPPDPHPVAPPLHTASHPPATPAQAANPHPPPACTRSHAPPHSRDRLQPPCIASSPPSGAATLRSGPPRPV